MPKEILLEILSKKLFLELAFIIVLYSCTEFIYLKLGFRLNGVNVKLSGRMLLGLLGLTFYCLTGKQYLPGPFFSMGILLIIAVLLWLLGKIRPFKAFFSSFIIMFLIVFGTIIIYQPLVLYNKSFVPDTPMEVALGSVIEVALPAVVLFLIPKFNLPAGYLKSTVSRTDFLGIFIFVVLLFSLYYLSFLFLWFYKNQSLSIAILILQLLLFGFIGLVFFYFSKTAQNRVLEEDLILTHLRESYRLMEVFFSERREYRNQLQVMNLMAAANNIKELNDYIYKIIENMAITSFNNIQNPILGAAIVSRQVLAKEKGIIIVIQCDTPVQDFPFNPVILGQLFEVVLDLLIENELETMSPAKMIFVYIRETGKEFLFDFKNSEAATLQITGARKKSPASSVIATTKTGPNSKLELAKTLIKELGGEYVQIPPGNKVAQLKVTIKKT